MNRAFASAAVVLAAAFLLALQATPTDAVDITSEDGAIAEVIEEVIPANEEN